MNPSNEAPANKLQKCTERTAGCALAYDVPIFLNFFSQLLLLIILLTHVHPHVQLGHGSFKPYKYYLNKHYEQFVPLLTRNIFLVTVRRNRFQPFYSISLIKTNKSSPPQTLVWIKMKVCLRPDQRSSHLGFGMLDI